MGVVYVAAMDRTRIDLARCPSPRLCFARSCVLVSAYVTVPGIAIHFR